MPDERPSAEYLTLEEERERLRAELARRHVASRSTGLILLPPMLPKPVPPPEFWTQEGTSLSVPRRSKVAEATAQVRAMLRAKRGGKPLNGGPDDGAREGEHGGRG